VDYTVKKRHNVKLPDVLLVVDKANCVVALDVPLVCPAVLPVLQRHHKVVICQEHDDKCSWTRDLDG
jgi:hypothetical protein